MQQNSQREAQTLVPPTSLIATQRESQALIPPTSLLATNPDDYKRQIREEIVRQSETVRPVLYDFLQSSLPDESLRKNV